MTTLIDLSDQFSIIKLEGKKSEVFLQGQVTSDLHEITEISTQLSAHCNAKGRVLSSFWIFKRDGDLFLCAPKSMQENIIKQLTPYARFSRVTLSLEETLTIYGFWGELPEHPKSFSIIQLSKEKKRYFLIDTKTCLINIQKEKNIDLSHDINQWKYDDISDGISNITPETSALFTPQMLDYIHLGAVSFKKGCYIGQEVIARTHYLGKAKRSLHRISIETNAIPKSGDTLKDEKNTEAGLIINTAQNPKTKHSECLAVIQNSAVNSQLFLNSEKIYGITS